MESDAEIAQTYKKTSFGFIDDKSYENISR